MDPLYIQDGHQNGWLNSKGVTIIHGRGGTDMWVGTRRHYMTPYFRNTQNYDPPIITTHETAIRPLPWTTSYTVSYHSNDPGSLSKHLDKNGECRLIGIHI